MIEWLRGVLRIDSPCRATLILMDDRVILGVPWDATSEEAATARDRLERWNSGDRVVVLPWPVDIDDRRSETTQA